MNAPGAAAQVSAAELRDLLNGNAEWALLDVREEGTYSGGHLLFAISVPISRLELLIADLVPHRNTRLVVCGGTRLAARAIARLAELGYGNAAVFPGDIDDWRAAHMEIYTGIHVPSKAFGEVVEARCHTPRLEAREVKARIDAGEDLVLLDSRPMDEYQTRTIPGAIDVPGVELVYHVQDLVRSPSTVVVVNCGGRTRSIIGAQSLINAGVRNPVFALKDGTMGWHLSGLTLETGQSRRPPPVSRAALEWARAAADRMGAQFGVTYVRKAQVAEWASDPARTLYVFDVRQPEEFALGHLPGSRHVQGGQLVQETDRSIAVRNARVVIVDDTGVRATVAASWLKQMGYSDVHVLRDGLIGEPLATGFWQRKVLGLYESRCEEISAQQLLALGAERCTVVDLSLSTAYRRGHIASAWFATRAQLGEALPALPESQALVMTSEDGLLAQLAAAELASSAGTRVVALRGGNQAWQAAGGALEAGNERWAVPAHDVWLKPFDQLQGKVEDRLNSYLSWEVGLLHQLERDSGVRFRVTLPSDPQRVDGAPGRG